jgi:hypothetical protein
MISAMRATNSASFPAGHISAPHGMSTFVNPRNVDDLISIYKGANISHDSMIAYIKDTLMASRGSCVYSSDPEHTKVFLGVLMREGEFDINAPVKHGYRLLDAAVREDNVEHALILLKHGADFRFLDSSLFEFMSPEMESVLCENPHVCFDETVSIYKFDRVDEDLKHILWWSADDENEFKKFAALGCENEILRSDIRNDEFSDEDDEVMAALCGAVINNRLSDEGNEVMTALSRASTQLTDIESPLDDSI